jgi:NADPH-dependent 2,4-dienoyl-CoA reductase/sulfur reductase-like enzyme
MLERVVVVGASLAGLRACETLRTKGFAGRITLIGEEPGVPYDRPPLSKKVLSGEWEPDRILLRKGDTIDELAVDRVESVRAVDLDLAARAVSCDNGERYPYDGLVIATGAVPRVLPGQPALAGIHVLRTLADSLALRAELVAGARVVVIGAGFIGLEVAATARQVGCEVTVLEGLPVPLSRGLGERMGAAVSAVHADHGVAVRCGVTVEALEGEERVTGVRLGGGEVVPADVVVVGIGVRPATDWLEGSGLELRDGVVCDATLAAAPMVYAAGDVCRWPNGLYGEEMRVEHWSNANEQATAAAENLLAVGAGEEPRPFESLPFFWSDQYDRRIQFLGRAPAGAEVEVVHGSVDDRQFVALYGAGGRLAGVLGMSMPRQVMSYRQMLLQRVPWDAALELARETG